MLADPDCRETASDVQLDYSNTLELDHANLLVLFSRTLGSK
jgi:hypothetical protein